ncbi:DUF6415 family natural product biosynthesis protein [Streptomyces sp. NPDC006355]|uniref:DUF6415 family natural product biosynthesis protein n=1 Tax=Streptomyces sp. NPDC006355 TaxID=3156758 RepID=UPI0033AF8BDC
MTTAPARPDVAPFVDLRSGEADPVPSLIAEAFAAGRGYVTPERFTELDKLLREEIERLTPIVQRIADGRPHRSRDWYAAVNAIDAAEHALTYQVATTPLAGSINVAELARRVLDLRRIGGVPS